MSLPTRRRVVQFTKFGGVDVLNTVELDVVPPGKDEVLVAIEAVGVNFADTMVRRGEYRRDQQLPHIPGMEACGTVLASHAAHIPVGSRVALFLEHGGGYADVATVPADQAFVIDRRYPPTTVAAAFLQGVTSWYAVRRYANVQPGETVLITGAAGGVGSLCVQLAVEAGARVIGVASTPSKREFAASLGCSHILPPDDLRRAVRDVAPEGVEVVIDGVGGELFEPLLGTLAQNGRFIIVGSASQAPARLDVRHLLPRGQTIAGFVVRNVMNLDAREPLKALQEILRRVDEEIVRLEMDVLPMSRARDAHVRIESRTVTGKIVLDPTA